MIKKCMYFMCITVLVLLCGCKKEEKDVSIKVNEEATTSPTGIEAGVTTLEPTIEATNKATIIPTKAVTNSSSNVSLIEAKNSSKFKVCIDAGHQEKAMTDHEPIGPGATETKPKVSSGTTGVASRIPEYKVTLQVSLLLRDLLKQKGYNVIMVRESHQVTLSNSERAKIANDNNADAFIRIHCNGATDSNVKGALTMCQKKSNPYCGQYYNKSRSLSDKVLKRLCEATGAKNRGVSETDSMSGINWCSVPVTIVEMGFMSNREEDLLLVDENYQKKLAVGIANGVIEYLNAQ